MRLERPNGYFQYFGPGYDIQGETKSCVHCGFTWIYDPGASFRRKLGYIIQPKTRGTCLKCYGLVCARPQCLKKGCLPLMKQIEELEKTPLLLA